MRASKDDGPAGDDARVSVLVLIPATVAKAALPTLDGYPYPTHSLVVHSGPFASRTVR
jgi:hypothetical protein